MTGKIWSSFSKKIDRLKNSEYFKNVIILMSGAGISQVILIAASPILTRLYNPVAFGEYEVFNSAVTLFLALVFLNYDVGIYTERDESLSINALGAAVFVLLSISFLIFVFLILGKNWFARITGFKANEYLEFLIPTYLIFAGGYKLLIAWFIKFGKFKLISKVRILLSVIIISLQISFGLLNLGYWGLVLSTVSVQIITFFVLFFPFLKFYKIELKSISISKIKSQLIKDKKFPLLVLPGNFLNNFTQNLPAFFLSKIDPVVLGYYGLSRRIIGFPLSFISSAVQNIFMKDASDEYNKTGKTQNSYRKNMFIFIIISGVLFVGILTLSDIWIPIIFGKKWSGASKYMLILSIFYLIRFVSGGLSFIMVFGKGPRIDIFWQIGLFLTSFLSLYLPIKFELSVYYVVLIFVTATSIFYLFYISQSHRFANDDNK